MPTTNMITVYGSTKSTLQWIEERLPLLGLIVAMTSVVLQYFRSRKQIVFEAWVNMADSKDSNLGRSLADLLLFKLRFVKRIHEKSVRKIETWQPAQDMPAFRQELDQDIKLMGSLELGKYGTILGGVVTFFFKLLPIMFRPARLHGSVHGYGTQTRLLATLEFFGRHKLGHSSLYLWEIVKSEPSPERLPDAVEELAYRIYLDLTAEDVFKSWESFRAYTMGLSCYLSWVDLQRESDWDDAEKNYAEALKFEPNNAAVKYNLALLKYFRWRQASNEQAIVLFRGALNTPQTRLKARAHSGLANALLSQFHRFNVRDSSLLNDAVYHGRLAIALDSELDGAHKAYAYACHQLSEYQHDNPQKWSKDAAGKNREQAISHYRRAAELNPQHYIAHNNLGNLYLEWARRSSDLIERNQRLSLAIHECEAALKISPAYIHAHDNLGNAYYEGGELSKAGAAYKDALQYKPDYPEAKNDLAMLHLEPSYEVHDTEKALILHLEALTNAADSESQRRKLCSHFATRLAARAPGNHVGDVSDLDRIRDSLLALGCQCCRGLNSSPVGTIADQPV